MPIYEYRCTSCGQLTEIHHGFDEKHTGVCPICGDALTRHFSASNILFRGSGFYVNDSRPSGEKSGDAPPTAETPPAAGTAPVVGPAPASGTTPASGAAPASGTAPAPAPPAKPASDAG